MKISGSKEMLKQSRKVITQRVSTKIDLNRVTYPLRGQINQNSDKLKDTIKRRHISNSHKGQENS